MDNLAFYLYCVLLYLSGNLVTSETGTWEPWSECSKTCEIGTRRRSRFDSNGQNQETVEEYCNLKYCPEDWVACDGSTSACYNAFSSSRFQCTSSRCVCSLGLGYNVNNCFPEVKNCIMREAPPTALGFRDPSIDYYFDSNLYSCTADDNANYEVHVIGIYGDECYSSYKVTVVPSGPVNKPIIIILTSYETTHWIVDSFVPLEKVLFNSHTGESTVTVSPASRCDVLSERRSYLTFGYGTDTGGGRTLKLLQNITAEFGPVTSFTGYYSLVSRTSIVANIIIKVGGSPLDVTTRNKTYDYSSMDCYPPPSVAVAHTERTTHKSTTHPATTPQPLTDSWSSCSKSCDIGIRRRQRTELTGAKLQIEEEYCNLQYCPEDWKSCDCTVSGSCYTDGLGSRGKCTNSRCHCTLLGAGYNDNNCYPEVGNCVIRKDPPISLGYKDPSQTYQSSNALYSCTTDDNTVNEVHVIGIYGDKTSNQYQVKVRPQGPVTKPIFLILTSYETTHWRVDSSVDLNVSYGGFNSNTASSTLQQVSSSTCHLNITKRSDLEFGFGTDTGGGRTLKLLEEIKQEHGPITSFTGYYWLRTSSPTFILNVGGYPMSILPSNFSYTQTEQCSATYETSLPTAQPFSTTSANMTMPTSTRYVTTTISDATSTDDIKTFQWESWSACSATCGDGIQQRAKYDNTGNLLDNEEQNCKLQNCKESESSLPIIVGASVGSSAITLVVVIIVIVIYKRKQTNDTTDNSPPPKTQDKDQDEHYDYIDDKTRPSHYQELTEKEPPSVYSRLGPPTPMDRPYGQPTRTDSTYEQPINRTYVYLS